MFERFRNRDADPSQNPQWQYLGELEATSVEHMFDEPWKNDDITEVYQAREEVSDDNILVSSGFQECSARILINTHTGATLLKHIGPENNFTEGRGMNPGDAYLFMIEDAIDNSTTVVGVDIFGGISKHELEVFGSVTDREDMVRNMARIEAPTGTDYKWSVAVDPVESRAVVRAFNEGGEVVYHGYQLPQTLGREQHSDSRVALVERVQSKRGFDKAFRHLPGMPSSGVDFRQIDETRAAIFGSAEFIHDLEYYDIQRAADEWRRTFVRTVSSVAADPDHYAADHMQTSIEAFDMILEMGVFHRVDDALRISKAHAATEPLFGTFIDLEELPPADREEATTALLDYYDVLLNEIGDPAEFTDEREVRVYPYLLEQRELFAKIANRDQ